MIETVGQTARGLQETEARISLAAMAIRSSLRAEDVREYLEGVLGDDWHARRILSLANASLGVIQAGSLSVSAIGKGLAESEGLSSKHAIKQVDRLLSNEAVDVCRAFESWVPFAIGQRKEAVVALDWTEFDADNHSTIALHLVTSHGRTTPLVWSTVEKSSLKGWRNIHEDSLLKLFASVLPQDVEVTVLADRGFGDTALYALLEELGFGYVIRFRGAIMVQAADGRTKPAKDWVPSNGRPRLLRNARVTRRRAKVPAVVCVKARNMKEPWLLAASSETATASTLVKLYGRRFSIEERFRDSKDPRFGFGLSASRVSDINRRDRLLLIDAFAGALLILLGAAGESIGMDRMLRANTVKRRTHSLFTQGMHYYRSIPAMKAEKLEPLITAFAELVREHAVFREVFGLI